jgi:hypothetical protein
MKKTLKYVNTVLRKNSFEELRELFINTEEPVKEISESYGCYYNLSKTIEDFDKHSFIHIGDASWCRTGLLFTFYSKSFNVSIDPDCDKVGKLTKWLEKWNVKNFLFFKG